MGNTLSRVRTRWAAVGAAVAITLGGGGIGIARATVSSGDKPVFVSIEPRRILDTRTGIGLDGKFSDAASRDLQVTGSVEIAGGSTATVVPAGATGVALNVTVVAPNTDGFLSVRPSGATGEPQTSNVNFVAGQIVPNAVNVDLPTNGRVQIWFEAWTNGGTGDVLVDVVGYYDDHDHDDRYYTHDQVNSLLANQPWSVSMPVSSAFWYANDTPFSPIYFGVAGGGSSGTTGLWLDNSAVGRFHHGFTLPPSYVAGTDVAVRIGWAAETNSVTGCGFVMEINSIEVARPGQQVLRPGAIWQNPASPGFPGRSVLVAPTALGVGNGFRLVTQGTSFTIDGAGLHPGDHVQLALDRATAETADTCVRSIIILGMNAEAA